MKKQLTKPLQKLREIVDRAATQESVARSLKITPQYLHDILNERRGISATIASRLGYQKIITYEDKSSYPLTWKPGYGLIKNNESCK